MVFQEGSIRRNISALCAVPPPARDCARLGARRASPRQGRASAANGNRKGPGRGGTPARKLADQRSGSGGRRAAQCASWWLCAVYIAPRRSNIAHLHRPWRANLRCCAILFDFAAADFAKIAKSWLHRGLTDLAPLSDLKPEIAGCLPALAY